VKESQRESPEAMQEEVKSGENDGKSGVLSRRGFLGRAGATGTVLAASVAGLPTLLAPETAGAEDVGPPTSPRRGIPGPVANGAGRAKSVPAPASNQRRRRAICQQDWQLFEGPPPQQSG
jgi:hypothetical protein